jgi:hypothetical protein
MGGSVKKLFPAAFAAVCLQFGLCAPGVAGVGDIYPAYIQDVSVVVLPSGGHLAGNLEVRIKGGFTVPAEVSCDGNWITTLKSVDADKRLFALLSLAQTTKQPMHLRITDDPIYTAFPGRCSLVWASLQGG